MKQILVFGLCLILGSKVYATKPNVDVNGVLTELEKVFSKINTVQTDFVQIKKLKLFKHPVTIRGHLLLQIPNRLLWRVYDPIQYVFMLNGKEALEWDQETGKKKKLPFADNPVIEQILVQIKSWFSGEFSQLKKSYDIKILNQTPLVLGFTPKATNKAKHVIQEIRVNIRQDRRYIESMVIFEVNGDLTTTQFQNVLLNQEIPAKAWEVAP